MPASPTFENLPEDKRLRVLGEAEREFAEQGYDGASMNRLTQRLGIAKGSLFKYFGTKEGCFRTVFDHAVQRFARRMRQARDMACEAGEDMAPGELFATIERLLDAALAFVREYPFIYRIYLKMLFNEDFPLRGAILPEVRRNTYKLLAPLVEEAQRRGELRPELDVESVVFVIEAVCERFLQAHAVSAMGSGSGVPCPELEPEASRRAASRMLDVLRCGRDAKEDL